MAATPRTRIAASERKAHVRRLMLAAVASGLVHLMLWGGLTTTRLNLLGSKPQDATAPTPALKPKQVADFPLHVPKSPASKPAHERPLDMQVLPHHSQDMPRPQEDRRQPSAAAPVQSPEQPLPVAVTPPHLERPKPRPEAETERVVARAVPPERRQLAAATAEPARATADRLAAVPGRDTAAMSPKPAAQGPRADEQESATVARRRPREVALTAPPMPVAPPSSPRLSASVRDDSEPPAPLAPTAVSRRVIATPAAAPSAEVEPLDAAARAPAGVASTGAAAFVLAGGVLATFTDFAGGVLAGAALAAFLVLPPAVGSVFFVVIAYPRGSPASDARSSKPMHRMQGACLSLLLSNRACGLYRMELPQDSLTARGFHEQIVNKYHQIRIC